MLWTLRALAASRASTRTTAGIRGGSTAAAAAAASGVPPPPPRQPSGLVLGIESSCDDTGVAVVSTSGRVLGESLATQADIHAAWGGVVPKLAQEAHEAAIDGCVEAALASAGVTPDQLDAVAVTIGPGLSLCLRVSLAAWEGWAWPSSLPGCKVSGCACGGAGHRLPACQHRGRHRPAGGGAQGAPAGSCPPAAAHPRAPHGGACAGGAPGRHTLCGRGAAGGTAAGRRQRQQQRGPRHPSSRSSRRSRLSRRSIRPWRGSSSGAGAGSPDRRRLRRLSCRHAGPC